MCVWCKKTPALQSRHLYEAFCICLSLLTGDGHPRLIHSSLYPGPLSQAGGHPVPEGSIPHHLQDPGGNLEVFHLLELRYDMEQAGGRETTSWFHPSGGIDIRD